MDKKETTRLLDSLIKYNRVDINNMRGQFPELGDAFMNVILAIDQEYGSGNIDRNLLKTPSPASPTLPIQVGDYIKSASWNKTSWVKIKSIDSQTVLGFDEGDKVWQGDMVDIIDAFNSGVLIKIPDPTISQLPYKVGDYFTGKNFLDTKWIKITEILNDGVIGKRDDGTDYDINKVTLIENINSGEFYIIPDPTAVQLPFKVGDYFTSSTWNDDNWVKITEIVNSELRGIDESKKDYMINLPSAESNFESGMFAIIPNPELANNATVNQLPYKVGDYFLGKSFTTDVKWIKITEILNDEIVGMRNDNTEYKINIKDFNKYIVNGEFYIIPDPTTVQVPYKVGDYFTGRAWTTDEWVKITEIEVTGIYPNYPNGYVKGINNKGTDYVAPLAQFQNSWDAGLLHLISNPTQNQVSFKLGDTFKVKDYPADDYLIDNMNFGNQTMVDIKNLRTNSITKVRLDQVQDNFKIGEYILIPSTSVKNPNIFKGLTAWTKNWKANGLRPSPTRKASLEKLDALGMGNDGVVYEVVQDKNGTKKWKKTGFTLYNPDVRKEFTSKYDLELLHDQIVYENSQLDPMDIGYNENEKLITKLTEELKTKQWI